MTSVLINIAGALNVAYQTLPIIFYSILRYEVLKMMKGGEGKEQWEIHMGPQNLSTKVSAILLTSWNIQ